MLTFLLPDAQFVLRVELEFTEIELWWPYSLCMLLTVFLLLSPQFFFHWGPLENRSEYLI